MKRLLRLPLRPRETLTSFISRQAALHGVTFGSFCGLLDVKPRDVFLGSATAIDAAAEMLATPRDQLERYAFQRSGSAYALANHRLHGHDATLQKVRFCPRCAVSDLKLGTLREPPGLRIYGRAEWSLRSFRTCPVHKVALVTVEHEERQLPYDFAATIGSRVSKLQDMARDTCAQKPSALERYILSTLEGDGKVSDLIADMPFYAVCRLSEMLGMVHLHGSAVRTHNMSENAWHEAGDAGFRLLSKGKPGVFTLFKTIAPPRSKSSRQWGPTNAFGRLYTWLSNENRDPVYDPIRTLIRDYCLEEMPLGPNQSIFGKPIEPTQLRSVLSIAKEFGVHPKRFKKILLAKGKITEDQIELPSGDIVLAIDEAGPIAMAAKDAVSVNEAAFQLGIGRGQVEALIEEGLLDPLIGPGNIGIGAYGLRREDLDKLAIRIHQGCQPIERASGNRMTLESASRVALCSIAQIVRLLWENKLTWKGKLRTQNGLRSIMVDAQELKAKVHSRKLDGVSLRQAERLLSTSYHVLQALIAQGILTAQEARNPITNYPQTVLAASELDSFATSYVPLRKAAKEIRMPPVKVRTALMKAGIGPAFDPDIIGATFYKKSDIASFLSA